MKDIKDLKENQLIEVNTIEESVFITKKLKSATPQFKLPYYVGIVGDMYYYGKIENEVIEKKIIPASKFLKPSKKELLKSQQNNLASILHHNQIHILSIRLLLLINIILLYCKGLYTTYQLPTHFLPLLFQSLLLSLILVYRGRLFLKIIHR